VQVVNLIRAVLFDLDDTLVDLREASFVSFNETLRRHNLRTISFQEMLDSWHVTWRDVVKSVTPQGVDVDTLLPVIGPEYMRRFAEIHLQYSKLLPGARRTLSELKRRGYLVGIVSRRTRRVLEEEVEKFKLQGFVDTLVGADEVERQKPDPTPILLAAKRLNVDVSSCVVVGDATSDIRAGKSAGAFAVGVLTGLQDADQLRAENPDAIIVKITDLVPVLETLDP
jgi:pyrophosphatase PpaX